MKIISLGNLLFAAGLAGVYVSLASAQSATATTGATPVDRTVIAPQMPIPAAAVGPVAVKPPIVVVGPIAVGPTAPMPPTTTRPDATTTPPVLPALPAEIQTLIDQFSANRDALIAAQQAVLAQLKAAAPADRAAIIAALQAQNKDLIAQQRALAKEIRDQLRQLRKSQPKPGGG